jgi:DNA polymerase III sliding clamp (beta) subunit (PCNA family)
MLYGEVPDVGRVEEHLACVASWSGTVCFRIKHLLDAVKAVPEDQISLGLSGELKPTIIVSDRLSQVVVPLRCQDC